MTKKSLQLQKAAALKIVRGKVKDIYKNEPPAEAEVLHHKAHFDRLVASGASAEEIQVAWHKYYQALSPDEKHKVWQEYYQVQGEGDSPAARQHSAVQTTQEAHMPAQNHPRHASQGHSEPTVGVIHQPRSRGRGSQLKTVGELKDGIAHKVSHKTRKIRQNQHVRAIGFALSVGLLVFAVNFNELIVGRVKAYVSPGSQTAAPVIIGTGDNQPVSPEPRIIIPKLNVDVPVVYDEPSVDERKVQAALERGVVHYAQTAYPGQPGNSVIVGHSSNNLLNSGKFKFAFVLLSRLENNDTFVIHYQSTRYIYRVYNKRIIKPSEVSVLGPAEKLHTMTLITCDPPGTAANRLIIQAEQISPEPGQGQTALPTPTPTPSPQQVPGNSPSFFQRIRNWLFH